MASQPASSPLTPRARQRTRASSCRHPRRGSRLELGLRLATLFRCLRLTLTRTLTQGDALSDVFAVFGPTVGLQVTLTLTLPYPNPYPSPFTLPLPLALALPLPLPLTPTVGLQMIFLLLRAGLATCHDFAFLAKVVLVVVV